MRTRSKGEQKLVKLLQELLGHIVIKRNYSIGNKLSIDIYIPSLNLGIEYDGIQHFEKIDFFHKTKIDFLNQQKRDKLKNKICKEKNICLIRISYKQKLTKQFLSNLIKKNINNIKTKKKKTKKELYLEKQKTYRRKIYESRRDFFKKNKATKNTI